MARHRPTARKKRMVITGANGLRGRDIVRSFSGEYEILATDREECDVARAEECMRVIGGFAPHVVVHCAAYTAVDRAEAEEEAAFALNAGGTRDVALACRGRGALLGTFGTGYGFEGTSH